MTKAHAPYEFPPTTYPGEKRRAREIQCGACPEKGYIRDNSIASLPDSVIGKKFRQIGWTVGNRPKAHRCPACATIAPRLTLVTQETPMPPEPAPAPLRAEPPPVLTPAIRREIADMLETAYDLKAQRYYRDRTDASVAEAMKKPRAWIAEVREAMFGPEANEAQEIRDREIAALEARLDDAETQALSALENLGRTVTAVKAELAKMRGAS